MTSPFVTAEKLELLEHRLTSPTSLTASGSAVLKETGVGSPPAAAAGKRGSLAGKRPLPASPPESARRPFGPAAGPASTLFRSRGGEMSSSSIGVASVDRTSVAPRSHRDGGGGGGSSSRPPASVNGSGAGVTRSLPTPTPPRRPPSSPRLTLYSDRVPATAGSAGSGRPDNANAEEDDADVAASFVAIVPDAVSHAGGGSGPGAGQQHALSPMWKRARVASSAAVSEPANTADEDLAKQRARLQEQWRQLDEAKVALAAETGALQDKQRSLDEERTKFQSLQTEQQQRVNRVLLQLLVDKRNLEQELARNRLRAGCLRLGQVGYERHGASFAEVWQDGWAFTDLASKMDRVAAMRDQVEKAKKKFQKRKAQALKQPNANAEEFADEDESFKMRLVALKRDEAELVDSLNRLKGEKALHIRELKRVADEDGSRFKDMDSLSNGRYVLLSMLGRGGFSEVFLAYDLHMLRRVACKIHQLNSTWNDAKKENYTKHACREFHIHKALSHPRIVSLFDVFEIDENSFCTVLQYVDNGDLDTYLKEHKSLPEKEAKYIISQVLDGLLYLSEQSRPVIHYDLKPANILFDSQFKVKITDFGLSKVMDSNEMSMELTSQGAGTYWYLPPECFELDGSNAPKISSKVDVWSVGVIFYQMVFGKRPFGHDLSQTRILHDNVIRQATSVEFPSRPSLSKEGKAFLRQLLAYAPDQRLGVRAAQSHEYLRNRVSSRSSSAAAAAAAADTSTTKK